MPFSICHYLTKKRIEVFWSLTLIWLISNRLYQTDCELNHTERARTPLTRSVGFEELVVWNFKYIVEIYLHIMACAHGCLHSAVFLLPFFLDCSTNVANESIASKTIPRRKNIVLRGTIGSGWEEGS